MTFGNGSNGCLGHGNLLDVKEVCTNTFAMINAYEMIFIII